MESLRDLVFEVMDTALANGYNQMTLEPLDVAFDIVALASHMEKYNPVLLVPWIKQWQYKALGIQSTNPRKRSWTPDGRAVSSTVASWLEYHRLLSQARRDYNLMNLPDREGTKRCARCKTFKPRTQFAVARMQPDGLRQYCNLCNRYFLNVWEEKHGKPAGFK